MTYETSPLGLAELRKGLATAARVVPGDAPLLCDVPASYLLALADALDAARALAADRESMWQERCRIERERAEKAEADVERLCGIEAAAKSAASLGDDVERWRAIELRPPPYPASPDWQTGFIAGQQYACRQHAGIVGKPIDALRDALDAKAGA